MLKVEIEFPIRIIRVSGSLVDGQRDVEIEEEDEDEESQDEVQCFIFLLIHFLSSSRKRKMKTTKKKIWTQFPPGKQKNRSYKL